MKKCRKCEQEKDITCFSKHKVTKDGHNNRCKDCKNSHERKRRKNQTEEKKEEMRKKEKDRYERNKKDVVEVVVLDKEINKICSICKKSKPQTEFFVHKSKNKIRSMCRSCSSNKRKEYYKNNKKAIIKQTSNYKVEKMKKNPLFKLEVRLRSRIYIALTISGNKKTNRTWKYLNCSPIFFQEWIKYQLYDGMILNNYGKYWHLDHVKPCSKFDLSKEIDIEECFSWKNIRPYISTKNRKKANKIVLHDIVLQELKVKCFLKKQNR